MFAELRGTGIALGIESAYEYNSEAISEFKKGQILLIGTDGLWETQSDSGEMFGKDRLQDLIRQSANKSSQEIISVIVNALKNFRQSVKQDDDITLAVIKMT